MASDWLGVSFAPDGTIFDASPTWVRLDQGITDLAVDAISIRTGRQSEFEQTNTGTCTVTFHDRTGVLDPTNASSTYYGKLLSRPFAVAMRNPVTDTWWPLFRGQIDDIQFGLVQRQNLVNVQLTAVDGFDYFANFELIPGLAEYSNVTVNSAGYLTYAEAGFDERINAILEDCLWSSSMKSVFTGNIVCSASRYSSGDTALQALSEAVEAELPTVAAQYFDKRGFYQAHGRYARFDPDSVSADATNWDFNRWNAGDDTAAAADTGAGGTARMQVPYGFQLSRSLIRNAALCYPQETDLSDLSDFIYVDDTSRDTHGRRTWTAPNLQIAEETTIGLTAKAYCQLISQYIVENYADPVPRIPQLTVGTERPGVSPFAAATWEFMCECNISDVVNVTIGHAGDGGFEDEPHFIEGLSYEIKGLGLDDSYGLVKMTADLSSGQHWENNPFGAFS